MSASPQHPRPRKSSNTLITSPPTAYRERPMNLASAGASLDYYPFRAASAQPRRAVLHTAITLRIHHRTRRKQLYPEQPDILFRRPVHNPGAIHRGNATLGPQHHQAGFTIHHRLGQHDPPQGAAICPSRLNWELPSPGAPTVNVNLGGWACEQEVVTTGAEVPSAAATTRNWWRNLADSTNPVSAMFRPICRRRLPSGRAI